MDKRLHTGRLVLTPLDPHYLPADRSAIVDRLRLVGLIDQALPGDGERYLLGEQFMQLVTFMGCSPFIRLESDGSDEPFCHLVVMPPSSRPQLVQGKNTRPPRCAACRRRLDGWQQLIEQSLSEESAEPAICPHCGHAQDPFTYDFRQTAGCGRFFLAIENIFPQEAIPSPALLEALLSTTPDKPWHYFYQQD